MTENNEVKNEKEVTEEENVSLAPYVNEKLKYYLFAVVIILCIIAALAVALSPEAKKNRENKKAEPTQTAIVLIDSINT